VSEEPVRPPDHQERADPATGTLPPTRPGPVLRRIRMVGFGIAVLAGVACAVFIVWGFSDEHRSCPAGADDCLAGLLWLWLGALCFLGALGGLALAAVATWLPRLASAVADWWANRPVSGSGP
jgi:hypothetical protein